MPFREAKFHLCLRMSHCGKAALALAAPRELALLAFPKCPNELSLSHEVDALCAHSLRQAGALVPDPDAGLSLPMGLNPLDWICPRMGPFTPAPGFGVYEGISTARHALAILDSNLPRGFCAQALDFGDSWGDSIYFNLAPRMSELLVRVRSQSVRHQLELALGATHPGGSPARL